MVFPGAYIGGEESKPKSGIPVQAYAPRPFSTNVLLFVGGLPSGIWAVKTH